MKKSRPCGEIVCLNRAAFRMSSSHVKNGFEPLLEVALGKVLGGGSEALAGCTEFTCNLYAPALAPQV
jgi:hypothetical protein